MSRRQFYDPQVGDSEASAIRGFQVTIGGTYVLMDDVVTALREYAQSLASPDAGALVHEVANWLSSGATPPEIPVPDAVEFLPITVHGAESDDVTPDVDRVEVFPDDYSSPQPKWYARSIDTGGNIMKQTAGSIDREWVLRNAAERWPGITVHELRGPGEDSMWTERGGNKTGLGGRGPSPKRLFSGVT